MIYVIDNADQTKEPTRKVTTDFFKNTLGFTNDDIIYVDKSELELTRTKFSAATKEAMKEFARPIFKDTNHSLAKQVLNIAVIEGYSCYFEEYSDFELTIELKSTFTLANAR